ncbi:MAG: hypothetical protein KGY69_11845 [Bacteroidales bacterium]|nr:hypothetical protein [Bacteroidales bacterium]
MTKINILSDHHLAKGVISFLGLPASFERQWVDIEIFGSIFGTKIYSNQTANGK